MSTPATEAKPAEADPYRFGWRDAWGENERGATVPIRIPLTSEDVLHPREGDFIVHHTAHEPDVAYLRQALRWALNGRKDARVLADVRTDWGVQGIAPHGPDLVVYVDVREREAHPVGTYRPKDYGARPVLVIEVTSPSTRSHDLEAKVDHYFRVGVPFYAVVDYLPEEDLARAVVLGWRATPDGYVRLPLEGARLWLEPVRLWLAWEEGRAVCYDEKGHRVPDDLELKHQLERSDSRNEELQHQIGEAVTARQSAEKRAKDEERQRRDAEKQARDLADRVAGLEAKLRGESAR